LADIVIVVNAVYSNVMLFVSLINVYVCDNRDNYDTIRYDTIHYLHWKTDRQAASL